MAFEGHVAKLHSILLTTENHKLAVMLRAPVGGHKWEKESFVIKVCPQALFRFLSPRYFYLGSVFRALPQERNARVKS